jgi:hypothetical protein
MNTIVVCDGNYKQSVYLVKHEDFFSLRLVKHHKMKMYGNVEVELHSSLNSTQDGGDNQFGARVKDLLVLAG